MFDAWRGKRINAREMKRSRTPAGWQRSRPRLGQRLGSKRGVVTDRVRAQKFFAATAASAASCEGEAMDDVGTRAPPQGRVQLPTTPWTASARPPPPERVLQLPAGSRGKAWMTSARAAADHCAWSRAADRATDESVARRSRALHTSRFIPRALILFPRHASDISRRGAWLVE
jgi:hypothetical protein